MREINLIINEDNFITDDRTNAVFFSSLLPSGFKEPLGKRLRDSLKEALSVVDFDELVNTKDVWARDFMPVQLTKNVFLDYTYSSSF